MDKKFKPFRTLKHEKPITKENWDDTAATPPIYKYTCGVVPLHLEESLEKQLEAEEKIKVRLRNSFLVFILKIFP